NFIYKAVKSRRVLPRCMNANGSSRKIWPQAWVASTDGVESRFAAKMVCTSKATIINVPPMKQEGTLEQSDYFMQIVRRQALGKAATLPAAGAAAAGAGA